MARLKKEELLSQLAMQGIAHDPSAKYNELYKLLVQVPAQVAPQVLTTQTIHEPEPEPVINTSSQNCGMCGNYKFLEEKGFLVCKVRGGKRQSTDGGDCRKFKVRDEQ
jgi:hypothetical protein